MKHLNNYLNFSLLNEQQTTDQKIYTLPGDPYEYKVMEDNWLARKKGTDKWFSITGKDFKEVYLKSIKTLDDKFPKARTDKAPKREVENSSDDKNQTQANKDKRNLIIDLSSPEKSSDDFNSLPLKNGVPAECPGGGLDFKINGQDYMIENIPQNLVYMKLPWKGNVNIDTIDNFIKSLEGYEVLIKGEGRGSFSGTDALKRVKSEKITKIIQMIDAGTDGSKTKIIFYNKAGEFIMTELEILRKKGN